MRIVLLFSVFLVILYIVYLLCQRRNIFVSSFGLDTVTENPDTIERMSNDEGQIKKMTQKDEMAAISSIKKNVIQTPPQIHSVSESKIYTKYPLEQLCIKASYNSAYTGTTGTVTNSYGYISDELLKYVLCRGCRFIDFETFYITDIHSNETDAFVGYSVGGGADPQNANSVNVKLHYLLSTAIKYGMANQFAGQNIGINYSVGNIGDPLFIQIRMNSSTPRENKIKLLSAIQKTVDSLMSNLSYSMYLSNPNGENPLFSRNTRFSATKTPVFLEQLLSKVVFVVENDSDVMNINATFYDNFLSQYNVIFLNEGIINAQTDYLQINTSTNKASPPTIIKATDADGNMRSMTDTKVMQTVVPSKNGEPNPNINTSIFNFGNQINLVQYYVPDVSGYGNLLRAEKLFDTLGYAFVPLSSAISYAKDATH